MSFRHFVSHKRVQAAKIKTIYSETCVGIEPEGLSVPFDPANKPKPEVGWYIVKYADGYVSFSPAAQFEEGYSEVFAEVGGSLECIHSR